MVQFNDFMKTINSQALPVPPSLISSLLAGFDAVTNHIALILFPIVLDLFLWWGPRVRLKQLVVGISDKILSLPGANPSDTANLGKLFREIWLPFSERLNIFSALRSYPVGIPSLMASRLPLETPLGVPIIWEAQSLLAVFGLWLVFSLIGLVAGSLYFTTVVQAALVGEVDWGQVFSQWPWATVQVVLLALFWGVLLLAISIPGSCLLTFMMMSGLSIGNIGIFLYGALMIWLFFPLLLSPHGIFINRKNMWTSVREGSRLTRLTLPTTALLFLVILLLSEGLDMLWRVPAESSWFSLVGIIGHAFVTTGLLAATFVYYRDAYRWLQRVEQQIKFST